jgi:hypothetical protein
MVEINLINLYYHNYKIRQLCILYKNNLIPKSVFNSEIHQFVEDETWVSAGCLLKIKEPSGAINTKLNNTCNTCKLELLEKCRTCKTCSKDFHLNCCYRLAEDNICLICMIKEDMGAHNSHTLVSLQQIQEYIKTFLNSHFMEVSNGNFIITAFDKIFTITCENQLNTVIADYITKCKNKISENDKFFSIYDYLTDPINYKYILETLYDYTIETDDIDKIHIIRNFKGQLILIMNNPSNINLSNINSYAYNVFDFCLIPKTVTNTVTNITYEFKAFYDILDTDIHISDIANKTRYYPKQSYIEDIQMCLNNPKYHYGPIQYSDVHQEDPDSSNDLFAPFNAAWNQINKSNIVL